MANWKPLEKMEILSKRYPRLDGPEKVTGKAKYTYDLKPQNMLYGAIISSPHPSAKVLNIDTSKVEALPGVKAVVTDIRNNDSIHFAGQYIAAVAATSPQVLEDALELFEIEYDVLPFAAELDAAMQANAPRAFAQRPNIAEEPRERAEGDIEAGFAEAAQVVEATYRTQVQTHSCLEVHGSMVEWRGDDLYIWDSTQAVHGVRRGVAQFLEIPENKVHVICHHMGAGFGSKLQAGLYTAVAADLAKKTGTPVKLMLSRKQDFSSGGNRPDSLSKVKIGANSAGKLTAFQAETYGTAGVGRGAGVTLPFVYEIPNRKVTHRDVATNAGASRAFRAPGRPQGCFAMEQAMDELAHKLGVDPLEFRLKNDPNETRQKEWRIGAEKIGWSKRTAPSSESGSIKRGVGLGASMWAVPGRGTKAEMTIYPDGSIEVKCGTQDIGTGTRTYVAAITAEVLGLEIHDIKPMLGESDFPFSGGSGGSTTVPSVAPAIKNTAELAKEKLTEIAAKHLGASVDAVSFAGKKASANGKSVGWKELCAMIGDDPLTVHGEWSEGLSDRGVAGCQFAQVAVDTYTGRITVEKVVAVADCGLILDRLTTESQVNGAVIQGVSYALYEDRIMDPITGTIINPNFEDYKICGVLETPEIEVIFYDEAERGVMGIGEPPTIPTSAAVANAVYNAIGVRLRELPMTPDKVLNALAGKEG